MKWSKLRSLVREGFAEALQDRLDIHSTAYGACSCGHAWLTLDKKVIANFCTRASGNVNYAGGPIGERVNPMYRDLPIGYGELSRQDAYKACWDFIHSLDINEAISDDDPLIQSLAIVDKRLGKRRLRLIDRTQLHPLAATLLDVRRGAEGIGLSIPAAA